MTSQYSPTSGSGSAAGARRALRTLLWATVSLSALAAGCDGAATAPAPTASGNGLQLPAGPPESPQTLAQLGFHTAQLGPEGTPMFLAGQVAANIRDEDSARTMFLRNLAQTYRLTPETGFTLLSDSTDEQSHRFIKLQQTYRGIPVVGREIVMQSESDGSLTAVVGELAGELRLDPTSPAVRSLDGETALARALSKLVTRGTATVHEAPSLRIFTLDAPGSAQLAYRALVEYVGAEGPALEEIYVSAQSGAVLAQYTHVNDALSRTVYDVKGKCLNAVGLPGDLARNEGDRPHADATVNNVYNHAETTYWYYSNYHGRDSYDDKGAPLKATVHAQFPSGFSCSPNNAAWLQAPYNQMVYGDGDGMVLTNLSVGLDVTAHELTHAVTAATSALVYQNESGALNEGMSDIIGSSTSAWKSSGGSMAGNPATITPTADHWLIGKDVAGPKLTGGALRFMADPTKDGVSKDYWPERVMAGGTDNGGVHLNSGIANLAFYLLSQGGKHPRMKTKTEVTGISMAKAMRIFYLANVKLFISRSTFQTARYATAQAAENLFGRCSTEWLQTHRAWDAVGVPGDYALCSKPRDRF